MDKDIEKLGRPVNYSERMQYAQLIRLDAMCDMLSSIIAYIGDKENIGVEDKSVKDDVNTLKEDFDDMLKDEIKSLCDEKNIPYTSRDTKKELIDKLRGE